jgi:hypothetical protein
MPRARSASRKGFWIMTASGLSALALAMSPLANRSKVESWSRRGWGACEGCGIEIGETFRCAVVIKPGNGHGDSPSYSASIRSSPRDFAVRTNGPMVGTFR